MIATENNFIKDSKLDVNNAVNPIQDGHFWGCSRMRGGGGRAP